MTTHRPLRSYEKQDPTKWSLGECPEHVFEVSAMAGRGILGWLTNGPIKVNEYYFDCECGAKPPVRNRTYYIRHTGEE